VQLQSDGGALALELHVVAGWGVSLPGVAAAVQAAVREHLAAMTELEVGDVTVVVDDVAGPV